MSYNPLFIKNIAYVGSRQKVFFCLVMRIMRMKKSSASHYAHIRIMRLEAYFHMIRIRMANTSVHTASSPPSSLASFSSKPSPLPALMPTLKQEEVPWEKNSFKYMWVSVYLLHGDFGQHLVPAVVAGEHIEDLVDDRHLLIGHLLVGVSPDVEPGNSSPQSGHQGLHIDVGCELDVC